MYAAFDREHRSALRQAPVLCIASVSIAKRCHHYHMLTTNPHLEMARARGHLQ